MSFIEIFNLLIVNQMKSFIRLVFLDLNCIFAPLINGGRVPQNLIKRLCL